MRKKTLCFLVSMIVLLGCGVSLLVGAAMVISDVGACGLLDGNGRPAVADSSHAVITPSGNESMTCQATVTPPAGGSAVQWDSTNPGSSDGMCGMPDGNGGTVPTSNWQETVSADGQATLTCHTQ